MSAWSDFWCRFSGEKQGSCAWRMDVIPRFQLEWEMLKSCLGSSLGPWQCLCHPSVPKKHPQSCSWLGGSQGSALGPAKQHFMELFICFMDINSFVCPNLFAHSEEVPAKEAVPHCIDGVKSVKKKSASPLLFLICCKNLSPFLLFLSQSSDWSGATPLPLMRSQGRCTCTRVWSHFPLIPVIAVTIFTSSHCTQPKLLLSAASEMTQSKVKKSE